MRPRRAVTRTFSRNCQLCCCSFSSSSILLSSSSVQSEQQQQQGDKKYAFRRTRRTNYADREDVLFADIHSNPYAHGVAEGNVPSTITREGAEMAETPVVDTRRVSLTHSDMMKLRRSSLFLNTLATPVLGRLAYYGLTAMAYVSYGVGRVSFYTRQSTAPPLLSSSVSSAPVQRLIEMGAYEEAAAAAAMNNSCSRSSDTASDTHGTSHSPNNSAARKSSFRGILHDKALECIYVGRSSIHSRGLMTSCDLPRGTRIITEPHRTYMDAVNFIPFLADTHMRLPDTWHYTHPSGMLLELVTQPLPHHLMNHSCTPNVCSGLSREFWPAANSSTNEELVNRIQSFPHFDDPNSFFTTCDVPAGSELTLSYAQRVAPLFAGEDPLQKYFLLCRCGSPMCRHFVYRPTDDVMRHVTRLSRGWNSKKRRSCDNNENARKSHGDSERDDISLLLQLGFDDETVMLSLLPLQKPLISYIQTHLAPSRRITTKGKLLVCYRHVFKLLNEAAPM